MTLFQTILQDDKQTLFEIIKIFHPYLNNNINKVIDANRVVITIKYDWIVVALAYHNQSGNMVRASLGIKNGDVHPMITGGNKSIKVFQDALDNNQVSFKVWRFSDDELYLKDQTGILNQREHDLELRKEASELLKSKGYDVQTAFEMYKIYHED